MNIPHLNDLDELFFLAQMLAGDEDHAAQLVEKAIAERAAGSKLPAGELLASLFAGGVGIGGPDLMRNREIQSELLAVIPRLIAGTSPERRLAVYQAFQGKRPDPVEQSAFMHRVRRALEANPGISDGSNISEEDVSRALSRHLESSMSPTPPSLISTLMSRYFEPAEVSTSRGPAARGGKQAKTWSIPVRMAAGVILILIASAIGTWIARPSNVPLPPEGRQEMLHSLDEWTLQSDLVFQGSDRAQMERFLEDRLGIKAQIPQLEGGSIEGLSIETLGPELSLGVIHYKLEDSAVSIFVLDYGTIQDVYTRYDFNPDVLNQIARPNGVDIHVLEDRSRMTLRNRDDVYVIYSDVDPQVLRGLLQFD